MRIETVTTGPFLENVYLVWDEASSRGVLIDPGDEPLRLQEVIESRQISITAILATHAHLDHISAVQEIREWSGAPFCIHRRESAQLNRLPETCRMFGLPEKPVPQVDYWIGMDTGKLSDVLPGQGGFNEMITILHTPGHTEGGVSYRIGDDVFVGDTLFAGSVGRTDLPGGDWAVLAASLQGLMNLPDTTRIFPGHGPSTTILQEKLANPFLVGMDNSTSRIKNA